MSDAMAEQPASPQPGGPGFASLTARESELLRKAGDRIFKLSRALAEAERSVQRLDQELSHTRELLAETRTSRDLLSAQVTSMHRELDREFVERSELRRLLASLQMQMQSLLTPANHGDARPRLGQGREAAQHSAADVGGYRRGEADGPVWLRASAQGHAERAGRQG